MFLLQSSSGRRCRTFGASTGNIISLTPIVRLHQFLPGYHLTLSMKQAGQGLNLGIDDVRRLSAVLTKGVLSGMDIGNHELFLSAEYGKAQSIKNLSMVGSIDGKLIFCSFPYISNLYWPESITSPSSLVLVRWLIWCYSAGSHFLFEAQVCLHAQILGYDWVEWTWTHQRRDREVCNG